MWMTRMMMMQRTIKWEEDGILPEWMIMMMLGRVGCI